MKLCKNCKKELSKQQIAKKGLFCSKGCATSYRQKANDPDISMLHNKDLLFYILGLIWSDGNLSSDLRKISICSTDKSLIDDLYPVFCDCKHRKIYSYTVHGFTSHTIINTNQNFIDFCMQLGLHPHKSFTINFPKIPKENVYSFIRGIFDGDGSIYIQNRYKNKIYLGISIVSANNAFLLKMQIYLQEQQINSNVILDSRGSIYCLKIYQQESIKKFYQYIYQTDTCSLHRKKAKFLINDIV